ncbi:hypothetical protein ABBQ32_002426 [Trebouxia sp. C0010 RCD-2024]
MSDIKTLHKTARTLILNLRDGLEQLERSENAPHYAVATGLSRQLQQKLSDLQKLSSQMESIWRMQVVKESAAKRDIWKRKVEQVSEETDALRMALDKHTGRQHRKQVEDQQRQELLSGSRSAADYAMQRDADSQGMSYVDNSKRVLEEAFQTGTAVLQNMSGQRERLKAAKTKALDVINSLGLSDSLLRVIERRQKMDKYITYGGMAAVVILLVLLWRWLK